MQTNEWIDRYVYAVTRRLPEKQRADVDTELRANIEDMLPEDCTREDVDSVLHELGNPEDLAGQYQMQGSRYLISPAIYGSYLTVVKVILALAGAIALIGAFAALLLDDTVQSSFLTVMDTGGSINFTSATAAFFSRLFLYFFQFAVMGFAWVTLVFAFMERFNPGFRWPFTGKEWRLQDLPDVQTKKDARRETVAESIVSIVFSILFLVVICFFSSYMGVYSTAGDSLAFTPLFEDGAIQRYIPFFLLVTLFGIAVDIARLVRESWNIRLAWANGIHNVLSLLLTAAVFLNRNLYNPAFFSALEVQIGEFADIQIENLGRIVLLLFLGILCVCSVWDTVEAFLNSRKHTATVRL